MPEPPKELPAFPNEAALQQKLKESRQRVEELEVEQKPSIHNCVFISIFWFLIIVVLPTYVIPKFKTILADMLGLGETLPEFTLLFLKISDTIRDNYIFTIPLILCVSGFLGFKEFFLPKPTCKLINIVAILLVLICFASVASAMFLPLFKMMDKLGQ